MNPSPSAREELLFLCLARNCEGNLPRFFAYLQALRSAGVRCHAIVGENGSADRTRDLILGASGDGVDLLDTIAMSASPRRLARMAIGRQMLLEAAQLRSETPACIAIADLDSVMEEPPAIAAVVSAIDQIRLDQTLFAIGATSHPVYYDLLALRCVGYDFSTLEAEIAVAKRKPLTYHRFHQRRIYRQQSALTSHLPAVCASSFNGFCLYNAVDYLRGSYRAPDEAEICEHVTMNLTLARITGKHLRISSDLVLRTPRDHQPVGLVRFWFDRIGKALAR